VRLRVLNHREAGRALVARDVDVHGENRAAARARRRIDNAALNALEHGQRA
jgi:hypothetical protein